MLGNRQQQRVDNPVLLPSDCIFVDAIELFNQILQLEIENAENTREVGDMLLRRE